VPALLLLAGLAVGAVATWGTMRRRTAVTGTPITFGMAAIDDAIGLRATPQYIAPLRAQYDLLAGDLARRGASVVVLPEEIAITTRANAAEWQSYSGGLAGRHHVALLASITIDDGGPPENVAWLFTADRTLGGRMTAVRGVENGYVVVRTARDGLLTVSDAYGRIMAEQPSRAMPGTSMLATIAVPPRVATPYARFGDWFGWLCVVSAVAMVVNLRRRPVDPVVR
jgi:hypothetical protein